MFHCIEYDPDEGNINLGPHPEEYTRWAGELATANAETDQGFQGHPDPMFEAAVALAGALPLDRLAELAELLQDQAEIRAEA